MIGFYKIVGTIVFVLALISLAIQPMVGLALLVIWVLMIIASKERLRDSIK